MQRVSASQIRAIMQSRDQGKQGRKGRARGSNKYGAQRACVDGHNFDSKAEAQYYATLRQWERCGLIRDLELQKVFQLQGPAGPLLSEKAGRPLTYKADFVYFDERDGREVIVDVKGARTKLYQLKKAIMAQMGHPITEVAAK